MLQYWAASQTENAAYLAGSLTSNVVTVLKSCILSHSRCNQPFAKVPRCDLSETILVDSPTAITGGNFPLFYSSDQTFFSLSSPPQLYVDFLVNVYQDHLITTSPMEHMKKEQQINSYSRSKGP